jgi:hypothetical protein
MVAFTRCTQWDSFDRRLWNAVEKEFAGHVYSPGPIGVRTELPLQEQPFQSPPGLQVHLFVNCDIGAPKKRGMNSSHSSPADRNIAATASRANPPEPNIEGRLFGSLRSPSLACGGRYVPVVARRSSPLQKVPTLARRLVEGSRFASTLFWERGETVESCFFSQVRIVVQQEHTSHEAVVVVHRGSFLGETCQDSTLGRAASMLWPN